MEETCRRAVALGLPAVAFTEHVDLTPWVVREGALDDVPHLKALLVGDSVVPAAFDPGGYLACVRRCRELFPGLRIVTGVEFGEPHRYATDAARLLDGGDFERVLGSVHTMPLGDRFTEVGELFALGAAEPVVRDYLAEVAVLVTSSDRFAVLAHVDYAIREWPASAGPFEVHRFEDDFRHVLWLLAASGRALEVNTAGPMLPEIVRWWRDEGGDAVTFGSDAHIPAMVGRRFTEAAAMVEANGFRPGRWPHDFWRR